MGSGCYCKPSLASCTVWPGGGRVICPTLPLPSQPPASLARQAARQQAARQQAASQAGSKISCKASFKARQKVSGTELGSAAPRLSATPVTAELPRQQIGRFHSGTIQQNDRLTLTLPSFEFLWRLIIKCSFSLGSPTAYFAREVWQGTTSVYLRD